jgi:hypothetical protein
MFRSIVVAYLKRSSPLKISGILGIGYGVCFRHLLSPRKSVMTHTVLFFFGIIKVGAAHSEDVTLVSILIIFNFQSKQSDIRSISFLPLVSYAPEDVHTSREFSFLIFFRPMT